MTEFVRMNEEDLKSLRDYAAPIWRECYEGIVPGEHTEMLISKYFDYTNILEFQKNGMIYQSIVSEGEKAGFIAFYITPEYLYLDKLYLSADYRGRHLSSETFGYLVKEYKLPIRLNVNRGNERALRAYKGNGFVVIKEEEMPQKGGFVNCDYVMEKKS